MVFVNDGVEDAEAGVELPDVRGASLVIVEVDDDRLNVLTNGVKCVPFSSVQDDQTSVPFLLSHSMIAYSWSSPKPTYSYKMVFRQPK